MYDDEFSGQGGSYLLDPKTGKRTRIEEPTVEAPFMGPDVSTPPPAPAKTKAAPVSTTGV